MKDRRAFYRMTRFFGHSHPLAQKRALRPQRRDYGTESRVPFQRRRERQKDCRRPGNRTPDRPNRKSGRVPPSRRNMVRRRSDRRLRLRNFAFESHGFVRRRRNVRQRRVNRRRDRKHAGVGFGGMERLLPPGRSHKMMSGRKIFRFPYDCRRTRRNGAHEKFGIRRFGMDRKTFEAFAR